MRLVLAIIVNDTGTLLLLGAVVGALIGLVWNRHQREDDAAHAELKALSERVTRIEGRKK